MNDIDYIMSLLDWNNTLQEQAKGVEMAKDVENLNVFIQPCNKKYNKNVWENCAKVLSERSDEDLSPYLVELLEWLQDLNWPGSLIILDRLQKYADIKSYNLAYNICIKYSQALKDDVWENNLKMLKMKN